MSDRLLARLSELPNGSMLSVMAEGRAILLLRQDDQVRAFDGRCPHAGAPLAEGLLSGGRLICARHKAVFCSGSGDCLEPPAPAGLTPVPIRVADGAVYLSVLPPAARATAAAGASPADPPRRRIQTAVAADPRSFVIVGAGAAGTAAARTLRAEGYAGRLMLIDHYGALPYDRTRLSKEALVAAAGEAMAELSLHDEDFYYRQAIERLEAEVCEIHPGIRRITLGDGRMLTYDRALIASGGTPRPADFPGANLRDVFVLRSHFDLRNILEAAGRARRVLVVGGGFLPMEVASSLRQRGLAVTVVCAEAQPFARVLGPTVGGMLARLHAGRGVTVRTQARIARLEGGAAVERAVLDDGEVIAADLVIVGLGMRPATWFVKGVALAEDGGLTVGAGLEVAEDLFAAGDIAAFPLFGTGPRVRSEHWRVACQHGRLAARNMLGAGERYDDIPYFWSVQHGEAVEYLGHAGAGARVEVRGEPAAGGFLAYYLEEGWVSAVAGVGRQKEMAALYALMRRTPGRCRLEDLHPAGSSPLAVLAA